MGGRYVFSVRRLFRGALGVVALSAAAGCTGPTAPPGPTPGAVPAASSASTHALRAWMPRRDGPDASEQARARLDQAGADLVSSHAAWRALRDSADASRTDVDDALERVRQARAVMDGAGRDLDARMRHRPAPIATTDPLGEPRASR